ncbi:hypothetical protein LCGC14_0970250 [marine sediment metagenome]|uniref:Transmembrane protein n=1 Tax=marine sediment metagenome TaxID=412755 RepID=A0A0F9NY24_9ZZZZ
MDKGIKQFLISLTFFVIVITVGTILFFNVNEKVENADCYENFCIKHSIDDLTNCKNLGYEDVGFLSSEHFYMCDEGKVAYKCIEYKRVNNKNRSFSNWIEKGLSCGGK